jgi:inositol oxygenase
VGDTFIVGCKLPENIVYPEFNKLHPDMNDNRYNTEYGIYQPNCGLDNCYMAYGHDEYMYQVLKYNQTKLPEEALYIIRYHSLYPWHKYKEYIHLMDLKDIRGLEWVKLFNKYDLYSKENLEVDINKLMEYYKPIIQKYLGEYLYFY